MLPKGMSIKGLRCNDDAMEKQCWYQKKINHYKIKALKFQGFYFIYKFSFYYSLMEIG